MRVRVPPPAVEVQAPTQVLSPPNMPLEPVSLGMGELARRRRVSMQLEQEIQARGVAQAIAFIDPSPDAGAAAATLSAAAATRLDDIDDLAACFVKDERSITASLAKAAAASSDSASLGMRRGRGAPRSTLLNYDAAPVVRRFPKLGVLLGDVHNDGLERLASHSRVRYVASSLALSLVRPVSVASASIARNTTTWGIDKLEIPKLWAAGLRGDGIRVGHLDTGVDGTHPALRNAIGGFMFVDMDGFAVPGRPATDTEDHGTHTAGTICGRPVGGRAIGVAPAAKLFSATVIERGNVVARILTGLDWAASQGIKVLSMSLGLRGFRDDFRELMSTIRGLGILPVIAVGNEGPGTSRSPGNYDIVMSVGACDSAVQVPDFSSSEMFARPLDPIVPDIVAPGVDVISAKPGGGFQSMDGSSMATPHIAGLAALLWQAMPTATVAQIENAIYGSCSLATMPRDRANRGLPNAPRAFQLLTGAPLSASTGRPARPARARKLAKKAKKAAGRVVRRSPAKVARRKRRAA